MFLLAQQKKGKWVFWTLLLTTALPATADYQQPSTVCNLTGTWKWTGDKSLDIDIAMTGPDTFNVTLRPLSRYWHSATGTTHHAPPCGIAAASLSATIYLFISGKANLDTL